MTEKVIHTHIEIKGQRKKEKKRDRKSSIIKYVLEMKQKELRNVIKTTN